MKVPESVRPLAVVLTAFVFWFVFTALTKVVLTCAYSLSCTWDDITTRPNFHWRSATLVLIALVSAVWVSFRIFYSDDEDMNQV
jgi:hypothetical protein